MSDQKSTLTGSAIKEVADLQKQASKPELFTNPKYGHAVFYDPQGNAPEERVVDLGQAELLSSHAIDDTLSLIKVINKSTGKPQCFYGLKHIAVVEKFSPSPNAHNYHTHVMSLTLSPEFRFVEKTFEIERRLTQKELLRFFRFNLKGCVTEEFVKVLERLTFANSQEIKSDIQRTRTNIGGNAGYELRDANEFPASVTLTIPIFQSLRATRISLQVHIEVNVETSSFSFEPYPGELENAKHAALNLIMQPVFDECKDKSEFLKGAFEFRNAVGDIA